MRLVQSIQSWFAPKERSGEATRHSRRTSSLAIPRKNLYQKYNRFCYESLEFAVTRAKADGVPYVTPARFFAVLSRSPGNDIACCLAHFGRNALRAADDLDAWIRTKGRSGSEHIDLDPSLDDLSEQAWLWATLKYGAFSIRSGHVLVAALGYEELRAELASISDEFAVIDPRRLFEQFDQCVAGSSETEGAVDGIRPDPSVRE